MDINFHQISVFHQVAQSRTISSAADALGISQPAVSIQLKQLERAIGSRLVQRSRRGITLTSAGQLLATYARRLADTRNEAIAALDDLSSLRRGSIAVAATPTVATYLLPRLLVRFGMKYPRIGVTFCVNVNSYGPANLNVDTFDVFLSDIEPSSDQYDFRAVILERFVAIASPNHALAAKRKLSLDSLRRESWIVDKGNLNARSFIEDEMIHMGLTIRPRFSLVSAEAVKEAVAAGLGFAFLPDSAIQNELRLNRLVRLNVVGIQVRRPIYQVTPKGRHESKAVRAFLYMLKHAARGSLPDINDPITPAR